MTHAQKQWAEWPLLFLCIWVFQSLELSILRLPFQNGALQLTPVILVHLSLTRNWERLSLLSLIFSFMGSFTIGYNWVIFVSTQLWMALVSKLFTMSFTVDSKKSFAVLTFLSIAFFKMLSGFFLKINGLNLGFFPVLRDTFISAFASGGLGYLLFPVMNAWDEYFNHAHIDAAEMDPDIIK